MTVRPILYSGSMVRAMLGGFKTQTRRLGGVPTIEQQPNGLWHVHNRHGGLVGVEEGDIGAVAADYATHAVGDRLYVREHWRTSGSLDTSPPRDVPSSALVLYEADGIRSTIAGKFRQGMHMPRWASRVTLPVVNVRVERLQDISEEDAIAEGVYTIQSTDKGFESVAYYRSAFGPVALYKMLWEHLNGAGSWDANPWVAATSFEVEKINVDAARAA